MAWTSPRTWTAGEAPTAATLNTHIRDNFKAIGDAWTSYTPTWAGTTAPAIGNGTIVGAYLLVGKLVFFHLEIAMGSTTTYGTGAYSFSLPAAAVKTNMVVGSGRLYDSSATTNQIATGFTLTTSTIRITSPSDNISPTVPWTWANGDLIEFNGTYEAA